MATCGMPQVEGPCPPSEGFVADFLEEANKTEDHNADGDEVNLRLSCTGYSIGPVVLHEIAEDEEPEYDEKAFQCKVVLRPQVREGPHIPSGQRLKVEGLVDGEGNTLEFSTEPGDELAPFIALDQVTGVITLDVTAFDEREDDLDTGIYFGGSLYDAQCVSSRFLQDVWDRYQSAPVKEGVLHEDNAVPGELSSLLDKLIADLAANEAADWHPGSKDCVRDLVHPSLFPFVRGESEVNKDGQDILKRIDEFKASMQGENVLDRWGRKYETSVYQWLPTVFRTTAEGKVTIEGYINNLDEVKYKDLYTALAKLFETFLPRFERVHAYLRELQMLPEDEEDLYDMRRRYEPNMQAARLRSMGVRVVTKIVDYELESASDTVDGVWHVEGMSSDHIIMTGIYVLDRAADFVGGDLEFKRAFLGFEGTEIFEGINQCRHWRAEKIVDDCTKPLGRLETPKGRLIVFPNSHIHKLSTMKRHLPEGKEVSGKKSTRRVIVFWVVDPERDVLTTKEVYKQQGKMTLAKAKEHRIALMEERKKHKGKLNGERTISLCEH